MKRVRNLFLFSLLATFAAGCVTAAKQGCLDELSARYPTYTVKERLVLFYGAKGVGCIQEWFYEVERDKSGKPGIPRIAYHKVKMDQILRVEEKQLKDVEEVLDTNPKNEEWYKLLEETGRRPDFEANERALRFRVARLRLNVNHNEFRKFLGEVDTSAEAEKRRQGYSVRIFLPEFDPQREAPFTAKFVAEAKRDGKLAFIGMTTVFDYELLGKKEPDPEFPSDPNRFLWKEKYEGLEMRIYKVMNSRQVRDKQPHYIEATRITHRFDKNGALIATERESKPALRIFASPSDTLDIVVLDTDREGDLGFGFPDIVEKLYGGITTGKELYLQHQTLLSKLFPDRIDDKRKPMPKPKPQKFGVVVAGTPVDPWEKAPTNDGWKVPHDYISEKKDNYNVDVVLESRKSGDYTSPRKILALSRAYYSTANSWQPVKGEVVEYYRPLPEFYEQNILEARVDWSNRRKIVIEREGKAGVSGIVNPGKNAFTEERPYMVEFSDGETRWRIVDRDKSGIFMYRMEVVRSGGSMFGGYSDNSPVDSSSGNDW
ncbi:MAG: hypothetical protein HYT98_03240 [Candidatus Sungbacteria bacterium]|nr:hypothetical protein [Candidatus Sungbacteria bacterium]